MNGTRMPKAGRSIPKSVESLFSADVRKRGANYHRCGAVTILDGDAAEVDAEVYGGEVYRVRITVEVELGEIQLLCECPHFGEGHECKHLWATLLAAEEEGLLGNLTRAGSRGLGRLDIPADIEDLAELEGAAFRELVKVAPGLVNGSFEPGSRAGGGGRAGNEDWRQWFRELRSRTAPPAVVDHDAVREQVVYVLERSLPSGSPPLTVEVCRRRRKRDGAWGKPAPRRVTAEFIGSVEEKEDQRLLSLLRGGEHARFGFDGYNDTTSYRLPGPTQAMLVERMCRTGRCMWRDSEDDLTELKWDEGEPYRFELRVARDGSKRYVLTGDLVRGEERVALDEPEALSEGLAILGGRAAGFEPGDGEPWINRLRGQGPVRVPVSDGPELVEHLMSLPRRPAARLPEALRVERIRAEPVPRLTFDRPDRLASHEALPAALSFDYDGRIADAGEHRPDIYDADRRVLIERDREREAAASTVLEKLGFEPHLGADSRDVGGRLVLPQARLGETVRELDGRGWVVEADGTRFQSGSAFDIEVTSGIDWFDIEGGARFGEQTADLPQLLEAARYGNQTIRLGDGSWGIVPEQWLKRLDVLGGAAEVEGERGVRLRRTQIGMLDALLDAMPEARVDERVAAARRRLREFERVAPADPPERFVGQLRPYQREGLGWLEFLRGFGFGGCLADDMGLGKTVQVLALLLGRRGEREAAAEGVTRIGHANGNGSASGNGLAHRNGNGVTERETALTHGPDADGVRRPSLVVAPKSVVFNWRQEAERFTPQLRVLVHAGPERPREAEQFDQYDLVLTTYGTLRRDAAMLHAARFDYIVLDEAQAIKNASTATAKAARLLQAGHRLALTGTPVENRLSELWSIFEFLNPGMLGGLPAFQNSFKGEGDAEDARRAMLARSLRPFLLRRTKEQVAADLPAKHEQELYCDLPPRQRRAYDELRNHYRRSLLTKVDQRGLGRSKMHVLEALLRLRQAACHPGLIDKRRRGEPSAKLDLLMEQLGEVLEEGHKALVFSQFTSLLALVRDRLAQRGTDYEYLDGRTRNRQKKVERFQQDPDCRAFLISLKAGGTGLNLTAAAYVFLLDPWWNPAVEAQAIDRAHRIGQQRPVFAYRLIARDTVEEKVLEMHRHKRSLAEAIINADNGLISRLTRDDLEHLLG